MKVTVVASTGTEIAVWREGSLLYAECIDEPGETQSCWEVDLFEVLADLAQLDLDDSAHAAEALKLAASATSRLSAA